MKTLLATRYVTIPEGVTIDVKSRVVTVTGPRGELVQSFKHLNLDLQKSGKNKLRVDLWFGNRKQVRECVCGRWCGLVVGLTSLPSTPAMTGYVMYIFRCIQLAWGGFEWMHHRVARGEEGATAVGKDCRAGICAHARPILSTSTGTMHYDC